MGSFMKRQGGSPHHVRGCAAGLLIALAGLLASLVHASEWRPMFDTPDGIQIFKKDATESGLIEFRGVGIVVDDEDTFRAVRRRRYRLNAETRNDLADARHPDIDLRAEPWSIASQSDLPLV